MSWSAWFGGVRCPFLGNQSKKPRTRILEGVKLEKCDSRIITVSTQQTPADVSQLVHDPALTPWLDTCHGDLRASRFYRETKCFVPQTQWQK